MSAYWQSVATAVLALAILGPTQAADPKPFPGTPSKWQGFARHDFKVDGADATVVVPDQPLPGPAVGLAGGVLRGLRRRRRGAGQGRLAPGLPGGPDLFGSPEAVAKWEKFHAALEASTGCTPGPA